jgi:predicted nucleic acid-binding protein
MVKLDDALANVLKLGFDTAPLIYFIERHSKYVDIMREVIRRIDAGEITSYSSAVTLTEVLMKPKRIGDSKLASEYRDLLLHSRSFTLLPISAAIAERAADVRARYTLKTPDALQLSAALSAGCEAFLTNDAALRRVTELRVLVLDDIEL